MKLRSKLSVIFLAALIGGIAFAAPIKNNIKNNNPHSNALGTPLKVQYPDTNGGTDTVAIYDTVGALDATNSPACLNSGNICVLNTARKISGGGLASQLIIDKNFTLTTTLLDRLKFWSWPSGEQKLRRFATNTYSKDVDQAGYDAYGSWEFMPSDLSLFLQRPPFSSNAPIRIPPPSPLLSHSSNIMAAVAMPSDFNEGSRPIVYVVERPATCAGSEDYCDQVSSVSYTSDSQNP